MTTEDATTFFAVQLTSHDTPQNVARLILRTAHDARMLFWTLEVLDIIEVGGASFLRLRTDLPDVEPLVSRLLTYGRVVISTKDGAYVLRKPDGKRGSVPMLAMHRTPKPGQQYAYRGPRQWEAQFAS